MQLETETFDPQTHQAFARELKELRKEIDKSLGDDDIRHLKKMERWGRTCSAAGYGTAWIAPNPISMFMMSQGTFTRWIVAHHVLHKGYDKVPGIPPEYTSQVFAQGNRRFVDWFDWMLPEAWCHEHNLLHHYHLNETRDPDLVERNLAGLRDSILPTPLRYAVVAFWAATWKPLYYAPNTLACLYKKKTKPEDDSGEPANLFEVLFGKEQMTRDLWTKSYLPYTAVRFGLIPSLYLPLGPWAVFSVFVNSIGAELMTNVHSFLMIATNHAGDDMYRFNEPSRGTARFYVRQVIGSVNFACGNDVVDTLHGWLNYQIEHHLWPDLPMLAYQRYQPRVKEICKKYGVPYVQESIWKRAKKLVDIMVGKTSMPVGT